jgi:pilus assembly protein CpaB
MLVTPGQAEQLALAASQTTIQLVLRNPLDHEIAKTSGTALARLFNNSSAATAVSPPLESRPRPVVKREPVRIAQVAPATPPPPKETPFVMEIISGKDKREQKFANAAAPEVK